jgi:hypothetical protein
MASAGHIAAAAPAQACRPDPPRAERSTRRGLPLVLALLAALFGIVQLGFYAHAVTANWSEDPWWEAWPLLLLAAFSGVVSYLGYTLFRHSAALTPRRYHLLLLPYMFVLFTPSVVPLLLHIVLALAW